MDARCEEFTRKLTFEIFKLTLSSQKFNEMVVLNWFLNNWEPVALSLISGLLLIFLVFILFRPWIYISDHVADHGDFYKFKIINFTLVKCTDLNIYLRQVEETDAFPKGKDVFYEILPINTSSFIYITGFLNGFFSRSKPHCIQVKVSDHNVREIVRKHGFYLELIVNAKHGISNLQTTKKRTFRHHDYVKKGKFKSGLSCKILQN